MPRLNGKFVSKAVYEAAVVSEYNNTEEKIVTEYKIELAAESATEADTEVIAVVRKRNPIAAASNDLARATKRREAAQAKYLNALQKLEDWGAAVNSATHDEDAAKSALHDALKTLGVALADSDTIPGVVTAFDFEG